LILGVVFGVKLSDEDITDFCSPDHYFFRVFFSYVVHVIYDALLTVEIFIFDCLLSSL